MIVLNLRIIVIIFWVKPFGNMLQGIDLELEVEAELIISMKGMIKLKSIHKYICLYH